MFRLKADPLPPVSKIPPVSTSSEKVYLSELLASFEAHDNSDTTSHVATPATIQTTTSGHVLSSAPLRAENAHETPNNTSNVSSPATIQASTSDHIVSCAMLQADTKITPVSDIPSTVLHYQG
jgi:hypothetical protein